MGVEVDAVVAVRQVTGELEVQGVCEIVLTGPSVSSSMCPEVLSPICEETGS